MSQLPTGVKKIEKCRISGSDKLISVLNLGEQALTGVCLAPDEADPISVPLDLVLCEESKFLQLKYTVDGDLMYSSYWYRSGTNQTMRDHLKGVVEDATSFVDLKEDDTIIDIGCNDGTLLSNYPKTLKRIGCDPSNAILDIKDETVHKVNNFFSYENLKEKLDGGKARIITSISMFYDLDNPHSFVDDIDACLADDGVWIVEMNYTGDMVHSLGYDMISHEHVAYYTLKTFERLIKSHGMYINHATFNTINGGSIRMFVSHNEKETPEVAEIRQDEIDRGLEEVSTYIEYGERIKKFANNLSDLVKEITARGEKVFVYGASTRGNTILQHTGMKRDLLPYAVERNPMKYGREMAGSRIPIISEDEARKLKPEYMLALPYYFLDEFLTREREYLDAGGKFIVPLPDLRIISVENGEIKETLV